MWERWYRNAVSPAVYLAQLLSPGSDGWLLGFRTVSCSYAHCIMDLSKALIFLKMMLCWIQLHRLIFCTPGSELWFVMVQSCLGQWIIRVARCLGRGFYTKVLEWVSTHMHSLWPNNLVMLSYTVTSSPSWHADVMYRKQVPSTDCLFLCLALKAVIGGSALGICGRNQRQSKEPIYF